MKAMIFSAGLGTRLQPLTNDKPKALIEVKGEPMLGLLIKRLINNGFNEIIVNVHHFATQIIEFLRKNNNFGIHISISDETNLLLDTGGGLKNAEWFFNDRKPFLLHNVDIFSDMDLLKIFESHLNTGSLVTLAVRKRESGRFFLFDNEMSLCGWENRKTQEKRISRLGEGELKPYAFSGIQIINPLIFRNIKEEGVFSIVDLYLRLASEHKIQGYLENESVWIDMGKKQGIKEAELFLP